MQDRLIPPTLRDYRPSWLAGDILAGLTLAAIAVPEQMATARLANMAAVAGLYAFVAGSLMFALLGRNRQLSVGADSTIAPVLAAGVIAITVVGTPRYAHLISLLAIMVGALVIAVGLLRMGWVAEFLSTPVVTGLLAGIAVEIALRQFPALLGLPGGGTTTIGRVRNVVDQIGHFNGWSVAIGLAVFVVIMGAEHVDRRIPGALIGLVGSTLAVAVFHLTARGLNVLGPVHGGLPHFGIPSASWADARRLVVPALTVAFICVAQTAATVRASMTHADMADDFNQDLVAVGAGSVVAGLSGSFAVNSSPPRTAVVTASGGRSQLTSLVAASVVLGVVLLATGLLKDLPQATLGAILVFVATRLFRVGELRSILHFDRLEFALAIITVVAVVFLGIEQGMVVALLLALLDRTRRAARPKDAILGRAPGTDHWIPTDIGQPTEQVPGVIVYMIYAPIWYGDADHLRLRIRQVLGAATGPVHALILDADAVADIDYTGARALGETASEIQQHGVTMGIARSSRLVHHDLRHSGLLKHIGPDHVFASVAEAVNALSKPS